VASAAGNRTEPNRGRNKELRKAGDFFFITNFRDWQGFKDPGLSKMHPAASDRRKKATIQRERVICLNIPSWSKLVIEGLRLFIEDLRHHGKKPVIHMAPKTP
jgi:hypothetical protein